MDSMQLNDHPAGASTENGPSLPCEGMQILADCETKAERLFDLLVAESKALRQFDSGLLLQVVSQKEYSLTVLWESLRLLEVHATQDGPAGSPEKLGRLKALLADINRLNRANAVFIEGALEHCQDLFMTLMPTLYGQTEGSHPRRILDCRGVTLKKKA